MLIFKIAWRNIFRHKRKTLVIGSILFLGAFIMTLGNGIISGLDKGLEKNIIQSFSGDLLIISKQQQTDSVLASVTGQTIEPITDYLAVKPVLEKMPMIKAFMPAGVGYVWILNETGQPLDEYILGVNYPEYHKFFGENLNVLHGRAFEPQERGVLVSTVMQKFIYDFCNFWVIPKGGTLNVSLLTDDAKKNQSSLDIRRSLVFLGLSRKNASLDVQTDVIGVFKFKQLNSILGFYNIVDIESLRECMGYFSAQDAAAKLSKQETQIMDLDTDNLDALFSTQIQSQSTNADLKISSQLFKKDPVKAKENDWNKGVFNLVFVKLKPNANLSQTVKLLNATFDKENLPVRAVPWDKAIGMLGQIAVIMKAALILFVTVIFVVAIFIIMNTLILAAMERVTEIGMMRAVGARKSLIAKMFITETFMLSGSFGGMGILIGIIAVKIFAFLKLSTKNEVMQIFFGGDTFHPILSMFDLTFCIVLLIIVTILALIYPMSVIRKITPMDAISRD